MGGLKKSLRREDRVVGWICTEATDLVVDWLLGMREMGKLRKTKSLVWVVREEWWWQDSQRVGVGNRSEKKMNLWGFVSLGLFLYACSQSFEGFCCLKYYRKCSYKKYIYPSFQSLLHFVFSSFSMSTWSSSHFMRMSIFFGYMFYVYILNSCSKYFKPLSFSIVIIIPLLRHQCTTLLPTIL